MKKKFINLLSLLLIALLFYYLYRQIQQNISSLEQITITPKPDKLLLSLLFMFLHYVLIVVVYRSILRHTFGSLGSLSPRESFGIYYVSNIFKYLPGKVWTYSILINAMQKRGYSLSKTLFANIILLILNITTPLLIIGIYYFGFLMNNAPLRLPLLIAFASLYFICLLSSPKILKFLIYLLNKLKKKHMTDYDIRLSTIFKAQGWYLLAYLLYLISLSFLSNVFSINYSIQDSVHLAMICLMSMTGGFLALFAPGGIGVQEAIIFAQITGEFGAQTAVVLSIAFRFIIFILDFVCAVIGLILIGKQANDLFQIGGGKP